MRSNLAFFSSIALVLSAAAACSYADDSPGAGNGGMTTNGGTTGGSMGGTTGGKPSSGGTTGGSTMGGSGGAANGGTTGGSTMGGSGGAGGASGGSAGQTSGSGGMGGSGNPTGGATSGGSSGSAGMPGGGQGGGGTAGAGGSSGAGPAGTGGGGSGGASPGTGPCDIYAAASPATPCIAAYSTTRALSSKYTGFLYQVRKGGNKTGSGGTTQDIGQIAGGFADGAAQDTFCGTDTCTISLLYDQSGKKNDMKVAPAGCYTGTAGEADYESDAKKKSITISGHKVYALYMNSHEGYRNNTPTSAPKGSDPQGIYEVADGTHAGSACCWDFGNASTDNCNQGTMNALFFGDATFWGSGQGNGPWFMADFEGGVWAGGNGASSAANSKLPASNVPFAFGVLKTNSSNYAIRVGNAQSGDIVTANDSALPKSLNHPGGLILGIGGDNSNSSAGTFFEGAITAGRPSDETDAAVLKNVQDAGYGK